MTKYIPKWMRLYGEMGVEIPEDIPEDAIHVNVSVQTISGINGLVTVVSWLEPEK